MAQQWDTRYPNNWSYPNDSYGNTSNIYNQTQRPAYNDDQNGQVNQILISTPSVAEELKPTYISGRYIADAKAIRPNEVRSDGNPTVFPLIDRSAIITKELNDMGTIDTYIYVRQDTVQNAPEGNDPIQMIMERLDNIEKEIKKSRYTRGNYKNKGGNHNDANQ